MRFSSYTSQAKIKVGDVDCYATALVDETTIQHREFTTATISFRYITRTQKNGLVRPEKLQTSKMFPGTPGTTGTTWCAQVLETGARLTRLHRSIW
jgi:hypothetical protein